MGDEGPDADDDVHDTVTKVLAVVAAVLMWPTFWGLVRRIWTSVASTSGGTIVGLGVGLVAFFLLYATVSYMLGLAGMVTLRRLGLI